MVYNNKGNKQHDIKEWSLAMVHLKWGVNEFPSWDRDYNEEKWPWETIASTQAKVAREEFREWSLARGPQLRWDCARHHVMQPVYSNWLDLYDIAVHSKWTKSVPKFSKRKIKMKDNITYHNIIYNPISEKLSNFSYIHKQLFCNQKVVASPTDYSKVGTN